MAALNVLLWIGIGLLSFAVLLCAVFGGMVIVGLVQAWRKWTL